MRVAWRVSEGEELLDSDGIDENVLQIFLSNSSRDELLVDVKDLVNNTDIAVDRLCIDKRNMCHRANGGNNSLRISNSGNQLVRSCTTAD
uniref:Uncharacterized protein n=1 Tax=Ditylenchus dipsaci TaxID=166011 RepID=A0A915E9M6_9BILA